MIVGDRVSFKTKAPSILGEYYKNVKIDAIFGVKMARKFRDVDAIHNDVVNQTDLAAIDINDVSFIMFENNGNDVVLSTYWLDMDTVTTSSSVIGQVTIDNIRYEDLSIIETRLRELGYGGLTIKAL
jgi:hypothetical protein